LKPNPLPPEKSKMSKDEAEVKAMELQRHRKERKEDEKLSEKEKGRMKTV